MSIEELYIVNHLLNIKYLEDLALKNKVHMSLIPQEDDYSIHLEKKLNKNLKKIKEQQVSVKERFGKSYRPEQTSHQELNAYLQLSTPLENINVRDLTKMSLLSCYVAQRLYDAIYHYLFGNLDFQEYRRNREEAYAQFQENVKKNQINENYLDSLTHYIKNSLEELDRNFGLEGLNIEILAKRLAKNAIEYSILMKWSIPKTLESKRNDALHFYTDGGLATYVEKLNWLLDKHLPSEEEIIKIYKHSHNNKGFLCRVYFVYNLLRTI